MSDKDKIEKFNPLSEEKYTDVNLDYLIMYTIGQLDKMEINLAFENIVIAAFKLFPKKFSLPGYPEYPDGKRIHDSLFRCTFKAKQWLGGKTCQGYFITDRSRVIINEAENLLSGRINIKKGRKSSSQTGRKTRRKESIMNQVLSSPAYIKYVNGEGDHITEAEFCFLLQGTLDTPRESLKQNLSALKMFAEELKKDDVIKFINWLEIHFNNFLKFTR